MTQYKAPIRRVDRGRGHSYVDANGLKVPGVTTILKALPKDALINWAANATADAAINRWDELAALPPAARLKTLQGARFADRDAAGNRGTEVHRLAEQLVHGTAVSYPDELAGHVSSYVQFLDEFEPQPVLVEGVVMSHAHGYAGTLDLIADIAGERWLLDIKTSRSGIFGETALQLAGYRYADTYVTKSGTEVDMIAVDRCGAIHVRADGYSLIPVEAEREQHRDLLYVQQVARWVDTSRELVGDPLMPPTTARFRIVRDEADDDAA